jgi:hypothetical protein
MDELDQVESDRGHARGREAPVRWLLDALPLPARANQEQDTAKNAQSTENHRICRVGGVKRQPY